MKVEEAKTKICPFMSNSVAVDHPSFRGGGLIRVNCICGDCMAWEYTKVYEKKKVKEIHDKEFTIPVGWTSEGYDKNNILWASREFNENDKSGYCKRLS